MVHVARGEHHLLDLCGCPAALLDDARAMRRLLYDAVAASGATILATHVYPFEPQGLSIVLVLAESHASMHTYPEHGVCMLDVFTCGDTVLPRMAINQLRAAIPHAREHAQVLMRGVAPRRR